MVWIIIIIAALYLLSPVDIIPGLTPVGWLDDIIILVLLIRYLSKRWRTKNKRQPSFGHHQDPRQKGANTTGQTAAKRPRPPHEILGIPKDANKSQIRSAYRNLVNQYHPDKVAHLGNEFQAMAEERFKEIQEAYDKLSTP